MDIIVSDTNILIDLIDNHLLDAFFNLPYTVTTIDLVVREIKDDRQKAEVKRLIDTGKLHVKEFAGKQLAEAFSYNRTFRGNVSLTDTTAILYAVKIGAQLFTGDMSMRRQAEERGVVVRGIIYVFDELVRCGIMTKPEAAAKLVELTKKNKRLPKGECDRRIAEWKN